MRNLETEEIEEIMAKITRFAEEISDKNNKSRIPVLFCLNCGSISL